MEKEMGRINNVLQKKCKRCSNLVGATAEQILDQEMNFWKK